MRTNYHSIMSDLPERVDHNTTIVLDTETTGLHKLNDVPFMLLLAIDNDYFALKWSPNVAWWLNKNLDKAGIVICHNAKYDWHMIRNGGVDANVLYNTNVYCTMVVEALINEHRLSYSLDNLGMEYFDQGKLDELLYERIAATYGGKPDKKQMANVSKFAELSQENWVIVADYGMQDIDLTRMLYFHQGPEIRKQNLETVVTLEMNVLKALVEVEARGVLVDVKRVERVTKELTERQKAVQDRIIQEVGWMVNPRSPLEMEKAFRKLGIPIKQSAKGKPTFAKDALEQLSDFPFIKMLQESRNIKTMMDTFIGGSIGKNITPNNRIHTNFNQTRNGDSGTGCMTGDTLILTDRGYIPIVNVQIGQQIIDHNGVPQRVIDWFENGIETIYEITTKGGHQIKVTGNHPVMVHSGWVIASRLKVGDCVKVYGSPEEFRKIPKWPFEASSWGRIRSLITGKFLTQRLKEPGKAWGHLKVTLVKGDCKRKSKNRADFAVHRLVAGVFCDNPGALPVVSHKNGIAWDNHPHNLEYTTQKSNNEVGRDHGSYYHQMKLTPNNVESIRNIIQADNKQVAKIFGVSREMVRDIKNGKKWNRPELVTKRLIFTDDEVVLIRSLPQEMTYGVEVENTHTHLTNGIVTHNTGRLSSTEPNLQQIPKRDGELAPLIRSLFYPGPGRSWIANDWEQFEFRVFAHYVKDLDLTERYEKDPHTDFHTALAEMTGKPRDKAKRINLGLVFGMGEGKLAKELGLPYTTEIKHGKEMLIAGSEAKALFEEYHSRFPKAKAFLQEASQLARSRGYVRTITGRRIRFPGGEFVHKAGGLIFQGTSADFMKIKLVELNNEFRNTDVEFVLIVHDEFCLTAPKNKAEQVAARVKEITEHIPQLRIPILADAGIGPTWWEAH